MSQHRERNTHPEIDLDAVRARYALERDQRLRPERQGQYTATVGELSRFADDPYTNEIEREPVTDAVDVVIIGAGIGALYAAGALKKAGLDRVRLIEQGGNVGGVWYWNRYPGARCDVESHIYLPLLEETGYIPSEKYVQQPEILRYCELVAEHFDLNPLALFQTEVVQAAWDAESDRWKVTTNRGDVISSRYLVSPNGMLSRPQLPRLPGLTDFEGEVFHTSRWDYDYTGGSSTGGLSGLADKRVGVIGTGATAIQCVPHLAKDAQELFIFQRTPSSIWPRRNEPTPEGWGKDLQPGWQAERMWNFDLQFEGYPVEEDLVADSWTDLFRAIRADADPEVADYLEMERVRGRIEELVTDPETANKLKPYFMAGCKRPGFSDDYLDVFNRPNVNLVDVHPVGIDAITADGIVAGDREYPLDCIIFATGFNAGTAYTNQIGAEIVGRDGLTLSEAWRSGIRTFQGVIANGFPNCFFLGLTQTAGANNYTHIVHNQIEHMVAIVERQNHLEARAVEPAEWAVEEWQEEMKIGWEKKAEFWRNCIPSRLNDSGNLEFAYSRIAGHFGRGAIACWQEMKAWRDAGATRGLEFSNGSELVALEDAQPANWGV